MIYKVIISFNIRFLLQFLYENLFFIVSFFIVSFIMNKRHKTRYFVRLIKKGIFVDREKL